MHRDNLRELSKLITDLGNSMISLGEFIKSYSRAGMVAAVDRSMERRIGELNLSVRATNILESTTINTLDRLVTYTREDLSRLRGCGDRVVDEISEKLAAVGLHLKDEKPMEDMPDA